MSDDKIKEVARKVSEQLWANAYENRPSLARRIESALREAIQAERDRWRVALDTANERANTLERLLSQPITPPKGLNPKERASFVINEFERRSAQARSRK